jgi:hypothetical protein
VKDQVDDRSFMQVKDLDDFASAMIALAELSPERMTASQLIFFVLAAKEDIAGKHPTYTDLKAAVGDKINKSLNTTYRIFLEPSRLYPNGLGWLRQEPNPDDNRVKFLRLTAAGREVISMVADRLLCSRPGRVAQKEAA